MRGSFGPDEQDEVDFYDEEYEDFFEDSEDKPIAVDEFFKLPLQKRAQIWREISDQDET